MWSIFSDHKILYDSYVKLSVEKGVIHPFWCLPSLVNVFFLLPFLEKFLFESYFLFYLLIYEESKDLVFFVCFTVGFFTQYLG